MIEIGDLRLRIADLQLSLCDCEVPSNGNRKSGIAMCAVLSREFLVELLLPLKRPA